MAQIRSLVRELRSHKPHSMAKKQNKRNKKVVGSSVWMSRTGWLMVSLYVAQWWPSWSVVDPHLLKYGSFPEGPSVTPEKSPSSYLQEYKPGCQCSERQMGKWNCGFIFKDFHLILFSVLAFLFSAMTSQYKKERKNTYRQIRKCGQTANRTELNSYFYFLPLFWLLEQNNYSFSRLST